MIKIIKNNRAFTLLEVIITTFIISLGLLGVMSLFSQTIKSQNVSGNELIASQLAQEGLEIVRNIRDGNWNLGNNYDNGLSPGSYALDYHGSLISVSGIDSAGANLKINNNLYELSGGQDSSFNRIVVIADLGNYLDVSCIVQWNERGNKQQYKAQTYLYDWY